MNTLDISTERLDTIWEWCCEAYSHQNIRLQFPSNTDRTKTYQWRYLRSIAQKFDEWDFDDDVAKRFISIAVKHAREMKVLKKGLAALHQANMLQVCYDKLQHEAQSNNQVIESLQNMHVWFLENAAENQLQILLYREYPDEFCNLACWFRASKLSPLYLALSKTCNKALARLAKSHPEERALMPKATKLFMLRSDFLEDKSNTNQAQQIFGLDWRKTCP